jgi:acetyl/propionyl-CoA carboxylase alpha subunit
MQCMLPTLPSSTCSSGSTGTGAERVERAQVFGDGDGGVVALADRECSVQRRHQKVIEEAPSPFVDGPLRDALMAAARDLCAAAEYRSAGTVEFLVDVETRKFYFLEVNTRLQVEHGITEMVTRTDIVDMTLRLQLTVRCAVLVPSLQGGRAHACGLFLGGAL